MDDIDLIVGGLAEEPLPGGILGPTFSCIIQEQLIKTRKADKFFYDRRGKLSSFSTGKRQISIYFQSGFIFILKIFFF